MQTPHTSTSTSNDDATALSNRFGTATALTKKEGSASALTKKEGSASAAKAPPTHRFPTEVEMKQHGLIQDRIWMFKTWKECFVAKDIVTFMVDNGYATDAKHAVELAQEEVKRGNIYYLGVSLVWL